MFVIRNIHALKSLDTSTVKVIGRILWSIVKGKKPKKENKELKTIKIRLKTIVFWKSLYLI